MNWSESDREYMQEAISLAERGRGHTSPNPLVGCVIVKDGRTLGRGWHRKYGDLQAEREALRDCTENPAGATAYVTLEPCCHQSLASYVPSGQLPPLSSVSQPCLPQGTVLSA